MSRGRARRVRLPGCRRRVCLPEAHRLMVEAEVIVHREKCEVLAQLGHELVLRPEGQRANTRMHTVGADQEVVALRCGPGEGDCDLRAVIAHAGDRIGETKHDVFAYRLVQDARKIAHRISNSPLMTSEGNRAISLPSASTITRDPMCVACARTASSTPILSSTSMDGPRKSTA